MNVSTPLLAAPRLSDHLGVELRIKRDDRYPFAGGGSKARKLIPFIEDARKVGANALVTSGSAHSNHARVVALAAAKLGWKCILVIHDVDAGNGNLKLMRLAGADLRFVAKAEVERAMDTCMRELSNQGYFPYCVWGGGHGVLGSSAFYLAGQELLNQASEWIPDVIIVASGTGGTQAGLHVAFKEAAPNLVVLGVSVARVALRGSEAVRAAAIEVCSHLGLCSSLSEKIVFRDEWVGEGYGIASEKIYDTIAFAARQEALMIDPIYSGKAMTALFDMCASGEIRRGARVVFWHTGSMVNSLANF